MEELGKAREFYYIAFHMIWIWWDLTDSFSKNETQYFSYSFEHDNNMNIIYIYLVFDFITDFKYMNTSH